MPFKHLHGTYRDDDVSFLLKPISFQFIDVETKEKLIQGGKKHYSEMLSEEIAPSNDYVNMYRAALRRNGRKLAQHINTLADAILKGRREARNRLALVSLARAGTPIGVLLTRVLRRSGVGVDHYSISIIRGRGVDQNALRHILRYHAPADVLFVDGWTGKGAIAAELRGADGARTVGIEPYLVVVADPAGSADLAATAQDYVIPCGILNGIVSGLVSRSILNDQIAAGDFHGCVLLDHLAGFDQTLAFIEAVEALTVDVEPQTEWHWSEAERPGLAKKCTDLLVEIGSFTGVQDRNRIKPGIAEATRALLRRMPERLFVTDDAHPDLAHLVHLAGQRRLAVERLPRHSPYGAVAIIAPAGGD